MEKFEVGFETFVNKVLQKYIKQRGLPCFYIQRVCSTCTSITWKIQAILKIRIQLLSATVADMLLFVQLKGYDLR